MMFCPKCSSLMMPKVDGTKKILHCRCGYNNKSVENVTLKEQINQEKEIEVVEKEPEVHPLTEAQCPKCRHKKAYFWTHQTRASDEPETKFFKCERCEHVWRDYS